MPMTGVIIGVVTLKDKTKPNFLVSKKSEDLIKICGKFLLFPSVIKRREFSLPKG